MNELLKLSNRNVKIFDINEKVSFQDIKHLYTDFKFHT